MLENAIKGDHALIKAWKADPFGNLMFRKSSRNFNPAMAKAADFTIVEVEEMVEEFDPENVHLPGIYVDTLVINADPEKRIEKMSTLDKAAGDGVNAINAPRERISKRAAKEFKQGMYGKKISLFILL